MMQLAMKKNKTDVNENDISDKLRLHGIYNSIINNLDINLQDVNNSLEHIKSTWHALKSSMDAINVLNKNTGKNKLYQFFILKSQIKIMSLRVKSQGRLQKSKIILLID